MQVCQLSDFLLLSCNVQRVGVNDRQPEVDDNK